MRRVTIVQGRMAPLPRANVDTDQIIPKQFLKRVERTGFGPYLFYDWALDEEGMPRPEFVLNQPHYADAIVLVSGPNFGSGSSREHAPWALLDYGIRAVISTEISDIFRNNSLKNGLVPIIVDAATHEFLLANPGVEVDIDVVNSTLTLPDGSVVEFPIDAFARYCLIEGIDQLGFLQKQSDTIKQFEEQRSWTP